MSIVNSLLNVALVLSSVFLILLVLIQRGKGGGLAGAFGGVGGSSAFGTKAGDVFTRITIYTALVWILLNMLLVWRMNQRRESAFGPGESATRSSSTRVPGKPQPADKGEAPAGQPGPERTPELPVPAPAPLAPAPAPSPAPKDELPSPFGPEDDPAKSPAPTAPKAP